MFHWKLSRKQKLLRNIVVMLAALGSLWWMLGFPVLTTKSLLRRGEQAYLLDEQNQPAAEGDAVFHSKDGIADPLPDIILIKRNDLITMGHGLLQLFGL